MPRYIGLIKKQKWARAANAWRQLFLLTLMALSLGLAACAKKSGGGSGSGSGSGSNRNGTGLYLSAEGTTVLTSSSTTVYATGGVPPYNYYLATSGAGTINSQTGLFTAGSTAISSVDIYVTDSASPPQTDHIYISIVNSSTDLGNDTGSTRTIYSLYNSSVFDHLSTSNPSEGTNLGFVYEKALFQVYTSQLNSDMIPLYRCLQGGLRHFLSTNYSCEGQQNEKLLGYIYPYQTADTIALYRFYNSTTGDHYQTTNYSEGSSAKGFTYEFPLGYVLPP